MPSRLPFVDVSSQVFLSYRGQQTALLKKTCLFSSLFQGHVECWDPRSRSRVGVLDIGLSGLDYQRYIVTSIDMQQIYNEQYTVVCSANCEMHQLSMSCNKGKVCVRAKGPIRPEFIPVSVAWSYWEYFYSPLDETLVHHRVTPSIKVASTHLYTWVERGTTGERKVSCPRTQHNVPSQGLNPDHLIWRHTPTH